jgi:multicomponent Na+:H+ antiporter subunit E
VKRVLALWSWAFLTWVVLTWRFTAEQLLFGGVASLFVGGAIAPLGEATPPWRLLEPRRLVGIVRLGIEAFSRIVVANLRLARRIWTPSLPLSSGMVIVPTDARTDGDLAAVGLITSLIVDNQLVDVDRKRHLLQYHSIAVPEGDREARRESINGPTERLLRPIAGGHSDA